MAKVQIDVVAEARKAVSELRGVTRELDGMQRGARSTGSVFKGALGAGAVLEVAKVAGGAFVGLAQQARDAASDLEQSSGAVQAVFKQDAEAIFAASEQAAEGLGLSESAYNQLAATLGAGLKNKGLEDFAGQTEKVIGLGADLAAQFGGPTSQAVEAIGSLMRGESDPIERYGVSINKTAINAKLAEDGLDGLEGAALAQAEAQAALALLFEQTADAQGAFSRESETLAGKQERNRAAIENLRAQIGEALLPAFVDAQTFLADSFLPAVRDHLPGALETARSALSGARDFLAPLLDAFRDAANDASLDDLTGSLQGAAEALGEALSRVRDQFTPESVSALGGGLSDLATGVSDLVSALLEGDPANELDDLNGAIGRADVNAVTELGRGLSVLGQSVSALSESMSGELEFPDLIARLNEIFASVDAVSPAEAGARLGRRFREALANELSLFDGTVLQRGLVGVVADFRIQDIFTARNYGGELGAWVRGHIDTASIAVRQAVGEKFRGIGDDLWDGFIDGVSSSAAGGAGQIRATFDGIVQAVKGVFGISSPSRVFAQIGRDVIAGLVQGLAPGPAVTRARALASGVIGAVRGLPGNVRTVMGQVSAAVSSNMATAQQRGAAGAAGLVSRVRGSVSQLPGTVRSAAGQVPGIVSQAMGSAASAASNGVARIGSAVSGLRGRVQAAGSGSGSWLYGAGQNAARGLANGMGSLIGSVAATARSLASAAISAARSALQVRSPSRVFLQIGRFVGKGFANGITGSRDEVRRATDNLAAASIKQLKAAADADKRADLARARRLRFSQRTIDRIQGRDTSKVATAQYKRIAASLRPVTLALLANASARDKLGARIDAEKRKLDDLNRVRQDYHRSVRQNARDFASAVDIEPPENVALSSKLIVQGLQDRLHAITDFRKKLARLRDMGINGSTYEQIASAGVEGGADTLNALLAGGKTAVKQVNSIQSEINRQSDSLGKQASQRLYQAGINAQEGLLRGLQADARKLEQVADKLAERLTAAVKKKLGIRSPSQVFRTLGGQVAEGLIIGLDERKVALAGRVLAGQLVDGFAKPTLATPQLAAVTGAGGRGGAAGQTVIHVRVDVPLGTSRGEVGREVVDALRAYQRETGQKVLV